MIKKNYVYAFLLLFCFTVFDSVDAMKPSEVKARSVCEKVELASAKEDGSLESVSCYETYQEAKDVMNQSDIDDLVIIEGGAIVDAKYALIDYDISYTNVANGFTSVYPTNTSNSRITYIRTTCGSKVCYGDDAALLEVDYINKRVKVKIAGAIGWIKEYEDTTKAYDIVPLNWVKSAQYYKINSDNIQHFFPTNVYGEGSAISNTIGRKPSMVEVGTYYSYDGNYFYTDLKVMLDDYKNNTYEHAVNGGNPFYNYYQYLSFRTKSSYNADNINQYITTRTSNSSSKMLNSGEYFINAQNTYGINAVIMMAIGMNESGVGTSNIALTKNNLFGLNAIDANPDDASMFNSVEDCINDYAYLWLSYGYSDPEDYRFYGAVLGNKGVGANVKYASDAFWAEKAAAFYYGLDKLFGFQDYDSYKLAVLNNNYSNTVYAYKSAGRDMVSSFYQYEIKDSSIVVLEEVEGPSVNGYTSWYKIMSDSTLDSNLNYVSYSTNPRNSYLWDSSYVYVPAVYFNTINFESTNTDPGETPTEPTSKPINSIVLEAKYNYGSGLISGISPGTSVEELTNNLTTTGGVITITDYNGNTKTSGNIGTGDKVNITSGSTEVLVVLIYGDSNGDGVISAVDYVKVKNHIMGSSLLADIYLKAADVNTDGKITAVDYVNIKNYIMGSSNVIKN